VVPVGQEVLASMSFQEDPAALAIQEVQVLGVALALVQQVLALLLMGLASV